MKRTAILVALAAIGSLIQGASALEFSIVHDCVHPLESAASRTGAVGVPGIAINVTAAEFYASFAGIFRLSDGSRISAPLR
jgi:hypothetical protein